MGLRCCGFQSQDVGSFREAADVERSLWDPGRKYSRESRKQGMMGASKNRDTKGQERLILVGNKMAHEGQGMDLDNL